MSFASLYRNFFRTYDFFHRYAMYVWFLGLAGCLVVALLKLGDNWMRAICLLTVYPVIIGWFGFNGLGMTLKSIARRRRVAHSERAYAWSILLTFFIVGIGFAALAIWFLYVALTMFER